jgi:hypothetical protein
MLADYPMDGEYDGSDHENAVDDEEDGEEEEDDDDMNGMRTRRQSDVQMD